MEHDTEMEHDDVVLRLTYKEFDLICAALDRYAQSKIEAVDSARIHGTDADELVAAADAADNLRLSLTVCDGR